MTTMARWGAMSRRAVLAAGIAVMGVGPGARAQPAVADAGQATVAAPPSSAASGLPGPMDPCTRRPELCKALHDANLALIAAAQANQGGAYVCTGLRHLPGCGTTSPQPYLAPDSPSGNPGDVDEGRRLLDWYLKNLTCQTRCQPKIGVHACVKACGLGKDPRELPDRKRLPAPPQAPAASR